MNNRPDAPKHVTEGGKDGKKSNNGGKSPFGNPNAQRMWVILGIIVLVMFLLFSMAGADPTAAMAWRSTAWHRISVRAAWNALTNMAAPIS